MDYVQGLGSITQPTHLPYRAVLLGAGTGLATAVPLCQLRVFLTLLSEISAASPKVEGRLLWCRVTVLQQQNAREGVRISWTFPFFCLSYW